VKIHTPALLAANAMCLHRALQRRQSVGVGNEKKEEKKNSHTLLHLLGLLG
jgi:hypothetical protein